MRVAFFGTPDFAASSLRSMLGSRHEVVAVVSQPDRRAGRGKKLRAPPVAALARVGVDSARSSLERAQLYLGRTAIRAPFNAFVKEEAADLGQLVTPQSKLGVLSVKPRIVLE